MPLIIQFSAKQTAGVIFLHYFLCQSDFKEHFHQLMEQMAGDLGQ